MKPHIAAGYERHMATRKRIRAPGSTEAGRVLILFEQMQNHIRGFHEGMSAKIDGLSRRFDESLGKVELRLGAVEVAVQKNSADIQKNSADIRRNSDDIEKLRLQVEGLTHVVEGKADERALASLEVRVARLE